MQISIMVQFRDADLANQYGKFYRITEYPVAGVAPQDKFLRGTFVWDIDSNSDEMSAGTDVFWEQVNNQERYLRPENGAAFAILNGVTFAQLTFYDLRNANYSTSPLSASDLDPVVDVGTVIAVRTSEGNFTKLLVVGFDPEGSKYNIIFQYVLYKKQ